MKRTILSILAAVALSLGLAACQHQTMESAEFVVRNGDWSRPQNANYLVCDAVWDALDADVVDLGTVNAYLIQGGRQNSLPLVTPITYYYDNDNDGIYDQEYTVAENIRFDIEYGMITFIIQDLDGELPEDMSSTSPLTFRVVAIGD